MFIISNIFQNAQKKSIKYHSPTFYIIITIFHSRIRMKIVKMIDTLMLSLLTDPQQHAQNHQFFSIQRFC
jgi:hypothetical protein